MVEPLMDEEISLPGKCACGICRICRALARIDRDRAEIARLTAENAMLQNKLTQRTAECGDAAKEIARLTAVIDAALARLEGK